MNNKDILRKAIEKAVKNGYTLGVPKEDYRIEDWGVPVVVFDRYTGDDGRFSTEEIIFSHSFAKCFWGEGRHNRLVPCELMTQGPGMTGYHSIGEEFKWQYHLQQLALAEDRLKYLEKFL